MTVRQNRPSWFSKMLVGDFGAMNPPVKWPVAQRSGVPKGLGICPLITPPSHGRTAEYRPSFRKDLPGRLEERVPRRPLVSAVALGHEHGHHPAPGVDRQIGAVGAVVAKQAVSEV